MRALCVRACVRVCVCVCACVLYKPDCCGGRGGGESDSCLAWVGGIHQTFVRGICVKQSLSRGMLEAKLPSWVGGCVGG